MAESVQLLSVNITPFQVEWVTSEPELQLLVADLLYLLLHNARQQHVLMD